MANIFDKLSSSPVAFGVLNGAMESFVMGRTQEKKDARAKAEAAALKQKEDQKSLTDTALSSQVLAYKFLTRPAFANRVKGLHQQSPDIYSSIMLKALGNVEMTEVDKQLVQASSNNSTYAANYIAANPNFKNTQPQLYKLLKATAATQTLTEGQNKLFSTAKTSEQAIALRDNLFPIVTTKEAFEGPLSVTIDGGRPVDQNTGKPIEAGNITEYRGNNATKSALFWALDNKAEQGTEADGLSDTNINTMKDAIKASKNPLATATQFLDGLPTNEDKSIIDTKAEFFLKGFQTMFASENGSKMSVGDLLDVAVNNTKDYLTTEASKGIFAKSIINNEAVQKMVNGGKIKEYSKSNKAAEQKIYADYMTLTAMSKAMNKTGEGKGKSGVTYGGQNLFPKTIGEIGKNRQTANQFLIKLNKGKFRIKVGDSTKVVDIEGFIESLPEEEKANLKTDIMAVIKNHNTLVTTATYNEDGNKIQENEEDYAGSFPNLYKIEEIKAFIHGTTMGQVVTGYSMNKNVATHQTSNGLETGTPLPVTQIRLRNGSQDQTVSVTPEIIEFSKAQGFNSVVDMMKDEGYYEQFFGENGFSMNSNGVAQGAVNLYKASNAIFKQVPNIKSVVRLRKKDYAAMARVIINQDIDSDADVFQVVSSLMSDDFKIEKDAEKLGYSEEQIDVAIQKLSKGQLDREAIIENSDRLDAYIGVLNKTINNIAVNANQSQLTTSFKSIVQDLVLADSGLVIAGSTYVLEKFGVSAFEEGEGVGVVKSMNKFMERTDARLADAQVKSGLITIAYNRAKNLDPNGRISDRDFKAALESITASFFATNNITKEFLMGFRNDALAAQTINDNILEVFTNVDANSENVVLKKNIRAIKAIPIFKKVRQMTSSINMVRKYKDRYETNNSLPRNLYVLDVVRSHTPANTNNQVYEVKNKNDERSNVAIDLPIYTDSSGKMLTSKELQERGFRL